MFGQSLLSAFFVESSWSYSQEDQCSCGLNCSRAQDFESDGNSLVNQLSKGVAIAQGTGDPAIALRGELLDGLVLRKLFLILFF